MSNIKSVKAYTTTIRERVRRCRQQAESSRSVRANFINLFSEYGYYFKEVASSMGIDRGLLWRRLNNPMRFTMGELLHMSEACNIPMGKIQDCYE